MEIKCEPSLSDETLAAVRAGMRRHAEAHVDWEEYADLAFVARAGSGTVMGAALGESGRGWLHVSVVWVDESLRRQQIGTRLLDAIEGEARRRGCRGAYLDTFSYQASVRVPNDARFVYSFYVNLSGRTPDDPAAPRSSTT